MKELLLELRRKEVDIKVVNGELLVSLPDVFEDDDLLAEIKKNKKGIIDYFSKRTTINNDWNKISPTTAKEYYPVTPQQQRLFVLHQLSPDSLAYNMPQAFRIKKSSVDLVKLEKAIAGLVERHEILRTSFHVVNKEIFQKVSPEYCVTLEKYKAGEEEIGMIFSRFICPFDLQNGPLIRFGLIDADDQWTILLLDIHHIIFDGTSQQLLIRELALLYNGEDLPAIEIQYKDYTEWFHGLYENSVLQQKEFWAAEFATLPKPCELPTDFKRPEEKNYKGDAIDFSLSKEITLQLNDLAKRANTSLFTVLFSAYGILVSKLTNQDDIVIGTPIAGRTLPALNNIIGLFVNTLPVRFSFGNTLSYKDYLDGLSFKILSCLDNQLYPIDKLIDDMDLNRTLSNNLLYDTFFVLQNVRREAVNARELEIEFYKLDSHQTSKFDISLAAEEFEGVLKFNFEFSTQLFRASTIERFIQYFKKILSSIADNENILLSEIDVVSPQEKEFLFSLNHNLEAEYPEEQNIVSLFERQVELVPDKIAVKSGSVQLTYRELNQMSNKLARILVKQGCRSNKIVGLLMGKSHKTVIGMLAILKAGAAYMPIDIEYPTERIRFLLEDSKVDLLITEKGLLEVIGRNYNCIFIDQLHLYTEDTSDLGIAIRPGDLCYVIYTSGTTGSPKGVMVEHRNIVRLFFNSSFQFSFSQDDTWTMFHSHCFDFSVWEMYGALLYGGKVVIIQKEDAIDPSKYLKILQEEKVTILNQTPTAFYNLIQEDIKSEFSLPHLRYVIFGGEALTPHKLKKWHDHYPDVKLVNMFGITETTVHVTYKEIGDREIEQNLSNIGKPIPTTSLYLLDKYGMLAPSGVIGELYVGGAGVSRGYLNNPALTKERFIANPYRNNDRLYRTGDLARMLPDGEMEYLGRADQQVNLRGFRIEPGEIEFHLAQYPPVKNAVVIVKSNERGDKYLCAYYISEDALSTDDMRGFLQLRIPVHMMPSYFVPIDHIPYTSNNKIDVSKLPEPVLSISANYIAPGNEQEIKMAKIWEEELSIEKIGIIDNFFSLGGDSLKAIGLISEINAQFQCNITIADLYLNQTIEKLTPFLTVRSNARNEAKLLAQREIRLFQDSYKQKVVWDDSYEAVYPMNGIEKGMIFYSLKTKRENMGVHDILYHEQNIYDIHLKNFDFDIFKKAIDLLVDKHSDLRKIYDLKHFAHIVKTKIVPELNYIDLSALDPAEQRKFIIQKIEAEKLKATALDLAVLWRMNIVKINADFHMLVFDMHHSLFDGWSLQSFLTELNNTYNTLQKDPLYQPQKLRCNYGDHILNELIELKDESNLFYWRNELNGLNRLNFTKKNEANGNKHTTLVLGDDLKIRLEKIAEKFNTSLKHLCFSAYAYTMQLCSFEKDIAVGLITNNRPLVADGDKLLGCFLNSVPFRISIPESLTWREYIEYTESRLQELKKCEKIPFQEIVKLTEASTQQGNPIFDTCFNYTDFWILNQMQDLREDTEDTYLDKTYYRSFMNNNMLCDFNVSPNYGFKLHVIYSTSYFDESFIDKLLYYYQSTLIQFADHPDEFMSRDQIFSQREKELLLEEFNDNMIVYPRDKTVIDLYREQVYKNAKKTAVTCSSDCLSYEELNEKSIQVATQLLALNIERDQFVGILLEPSELLLASIFGILMSGGAFVPIDNDYPEARKKYIIENSGLNILISTGALIEDNSHILQYIPTGNLIDITTIKPGEMAVQVDLPEVSACDLAYVLYTSGSTGNPKGVMITHASLFNYLNWAQDTYIKGEECAMALFSSISFDLTITSLFLPLISGNSLHIYEQNRNGMLIEQVVKDGYANILKLTPSHLKLLVENNIDLTNIKRLIVGGEQFSTDLAIAVCERGNKSLEIYNEYGPTEATIGCVFHKYSHREAEKGSNVLIGKPAPNNEIYILDNQMDLLPTGVVGEVYIGGMQLFKGYILSQDTIDKLVKNPYKAGGFLYKTGDLARWDDNGNLEFLGRADDQVKLRGYRIELGEIEHQLISHPEIKDAVVVTKEKNENTYLVGYYVAEKEISSAELRDYLSTCLPHYMLPAYCVHVDSIPLNSNGKVDRKALPDPKMKVAEDYLAPSNDIEKAMVEIWSEILNISKSLISINKSFFELGGNSISLLTLNKKIEEHINPRITITDLFRYPTIQAITQFIIGYRFDKDALREKIDVEVADVDAIINELENEQL